MSVETRSPWLAQLRRVRPIVQLVKDETADVAIVGGGISGISTAYFLLKETDLKVVLLEKNLVAHGATGHNGGQVVAAFEVPFSALTEVYGKRMAHQGYMEVNDAWGDLREMLEYIGLTDMLIEVTGSLAISAPDDVEGWIEERDARREAGMAMGDIYVADDVIKELPMVQGLQGMPREKLMELISSRDSRYIAAGVVKLGVMNSALFVEKMAERMVEEFKGRFRLYENSTVESIRLGDQAALGVNGHVVFADKAVLCTNGYGGIRTEACVPPVMQGQIMGVVGYMIGKFSETGEPGAMVYFQGSRGGGRSYYYLTRRKYDGRLLTSAGGPETVLPEGERYDPERKYDERVYDRLEAFLASTLLGYKGGRDLQWKGLMGYTPTRVRLVGQDPGNGALMYNLGCNGIALLHSIAGGRRVCGLLKGEVLPPCMFDPSLLLKAPMIKEIK